MTDTPAPVAFAGMTVVEGPGDGTALAGRLLLDWGMSVSKYACGRRPSASVAAYREVFDRGKARLAREDVPHALSSADIVLTADDGWLPPGGIDALRGRHPPVIVLRMTPLGLDATAADAPASDLTCLAASGYLNLSGAPDARPVKAAIPFASDRFACLHGAAGLMLALRRRRLTGDGTIVDVALRDASLWMLAGALQTADMTGRDIRRRGARYSVGRMGLTLPLLFEARDGAVAWMPMAGRDARGALALVGRMAQRGMAPASLRALDWDGLEITTPAEADAFLAPFRDYFRKRDVDDLYADAIDDGTLLAPVRDFGGVLDDSQLAARGIWIEHEAGRLPAWPVRVIRQTAHGGAGKPTADGIRDDGRPHGVGA